MKKKPFDFTKSLLFRYRFYIGQSIFIIVFLSLLALTYFNSVHLLSTGEMASAVNSHRLSFWGFFNGDFVDMPYRLLQNLSIRFFGLSAFAIKLPSIVLGIISAIITALLINRWHTTNVSIITSILIVPTVFFLSVVNAGTPAVMLILYPALLLWLGSKIVAKQALPSPFAYFMFAGVLGLAFYTPYLPYIALICATSLFNPRIRMHIKSFSKLKLSLVVATFMLVIIPIIINIFTAGHSVLRLFVPEDLSIATLWANFSEAIASLTRFSSAGSWPIFTPALGLAIAAIAIVGLIIIIPNRQTTRYQTVIAFFVLFAVASALDPAYVVLAFIPIAILVAAGVKFILDEWYGLFPTNPYARLFGGAFVVMFSTVIVVSNVYFCMYAVHHITSIANSYDSTLDSLVERLEDNDTIYTSQNQYEFYNLLALTHNVHITTELQQDPSQIPSRLISIGEPTRRLDNMQLSEIVTSPRYQDGDLFYIYDTINKVEENNEE